MLLNWGNGLLGIGLKLEFSAEKKVKLLNFV